MNMFGVTDQHTLPPPPPSPPHFTVTPTPPQYRQPSPPWSQEMVYFLFF